MTKKLGIIFLVIGLVLISVTFGVMIGLDKERIKNTYEGCESILGDVAKTFSDEAEQRCLEAENKMLLVNYGFLGYIFGGFLLIIGIILIILSPEKKTKQKIN